MDANRYATKKTVAQGLLDIALLTSNASQLKYVLQLGQRHQFYSIMLVLIISSIVLQVWNLLFLSERPETKKKEANQRFGLGLRKELRDWLLFRIKLKESIWEMCQVFESL